MTAPDDAREQARLAALARCRTVIAGDPAFAELTRAAALVAGAPIACLALVDRDTVWLEAGVGLPERALARDGSALADALLA